MDGSHPNARTVLKRTYETMALHGLARRIAQGLVAGTVATVVMERVMQLSYKAEPDEAKKIEEQVRDEPPFMVVARQVVNLVQAEPEEKYVKKLGPLFHWGLGLGAGAVYAVGFPWLRTGRGILFGTGFFLVVDEGLNTVFGWAKPPSEYPWQAHARGLIAHMAYGLVADSVLRVSGPDEQ